MGFVFIGVVLVVLFGATVIWKRRENEGVDEVLRHGEAGAMHDANIQGRVDPSLAGFIEGPPPSAHAGGFSGTSR